MITQYIIDKINAHVPKGASVKDAVVREVLLEIIAETVDAFAALVAADVAVDAYPAGNVAAGDLQTVINGLADQIVGMVAADVDVAAYAAGKVTAGDLQTVINALADRITALEP